MNPTLIRITLTLCAGSLLLACDPGKVAGSEQASKKVVFIPFSPVPDYTVVEFPENLSSEDIPSDEQTDNTSEDTTTDESETPVVDETENTTDEESEDQTDSEQEFTPNEDPCNAAVVHLTTTCDIPESQIGYNGVCLPHLACEAQCVTQASCGAIFGQEEDETFNQCILSCYADGPATCRAAESYVRHCGYELADDWNPDGICNEEETCISNCAVASNCEGLVGQGPDANFMESCKARCLGADLSTVAPEVDCTSQDLPDECSGEAIAYCPWQYNIQECAPENVCEYFPNASVCTIHPSCLVDPTSFDCLVWMIENGYTQGSSSAGDNWEDDDEHNFYCEYYPYSPECDPSATHCAEYPDSPECDDTYEPYCVQHPEDPNC